ncbi:MAG: sulfite exporter TauE/SafE family protein [Fusobacteriaceae bacterium]
MNFINILLILLLSGGGLFLVVFLKDYLNAIAKNEIEKEGTVVGFSIIGFLVSFFDTLGIGAFAPMTVIFKQFKLVNDRIIPGTLNTALCVPIIIEALIFIKEVKVEPITLISMLVAAVLGAGIGAGIVSKLDEKKVRLGMALALGGVLIIMLAGKLGIMPSGGDDMGLTGTKLIIAIIGNFILGSLMTLGIGLYAPCMALVYALGLSPLAAFPIMMSSCAFLMPAASFRFIKENAYNRKGTLIITITGILGVITAAYLVKSLPLNMLSWIVILVVAYTSIKLFFDSKKIIK